MTTLAFKSLKEKKIEAIKYLQGNDTFVSLPTGYGKSFILPGLFNE